MIEFDLKDSAVTANAELKIYSTMRVGGPARYLFEVGSVEELSYILSRCRDYAIPAILLGNGSNTLFSDCGYEGAVLHFGERFRKVEREGNFLQVQSGKTLPSLSREAMRLGLSGLEFACGIPGSVGGGTVMNCGAFGGELGERIERVEFFNRRPYEISGRDCKFSYRDSFFKRNPDCAVTSVTLRLEPKDPSAVSLKMREITEARNASQGVREPSLGSVFLRLPGSEPPARLIDQCGLKGVRIGGAAVSERHAGFVVNLKNATSENILSLIQLIKSTVWEKYGILLQEEIRMI